jgi:hypothetical protein
VVLGGVVQKIQNYLFLKFNHIDHLKALKCEEVAEVFLLHLNICQLVEFKTFSMAVKLLL